MPDPRPIFVARPPKPVSEMTDEERRAYAEKVYKAFAAATGRER